MLFTRCTGARTSSAACSRELALNLVRKWTVLGTGQATAFRGDRSHAERPITGVKPPLIDLAARCFKPRHSIGLPPHRKHWSRQ